ncbi:MAG: class I SAM-dependent methyltransferase [Erysipelotrichaceae bacterium]
MKENKYDDNIFFKKYSQFPRSKDGLSAAGEWHELKKLLPNFKNKRVLDLGCGFGWHCLYAYDQGADQVVGVDLSNKMLEVAKNKSIGKQIEYRNIAFEDVEFENDSFDVVISSLALHYTKDFKLVCQKINKWLSKGGTFVFSVEHPIFTARAQQNWIYDENNNIEYWPVDNYFQEDLRETLFLEEKIIKYHRTLATYLNTLLDCGFEIIAVVEPTPNEELLSLVASMKDELRRPMMLLVKCLKK